MTKLKEISEFEKRKLINELNDLAKGLVDYKKRQGRHKIVRFTEGQMKKLDELRMRTKRKFTWLKDTISKYGGNVSIKIAGRNYNAFEYILSSRSIHIIPELFTALDLAINTVNTTIQEIEAIPIESPDWRDIAITKQQTEQTKKISPLPSDMQLHPKIIEVSKSLFETQHYAQAILEAFKAVNNFVKKKTGLSLDGKALMSKVFNENEPIIKLNELLTQSDRDEQEGFKFLFMGAMVGIRNPKAHDNVIQTDPYRTLEYLGFASLLMKRIEEGKVVSARKNV
jgi:uncharacterized protein (TIGR02391 family)